jgi:hypothetical protein
VKCRLNLTQADPFTAENAGRRKETKEEDSNRIIRLTRGKSISLALFPAFSLLSLKEAVYSPATIM